MRINLAESFVSTPNPGQDGWGDPIHPHSANKSGKGVCEYTFRESVAHDGVRVDECWYYNWIENVSSTLSHPGTSITQATHTTQAIHVTPQVTVFLSCRAVTRLFEHQDGVGLR